MIDASKPRISREIQKESNSPCNFFAIMVMHTVYHDLLKQSDVTQLMEMLIVVLYKLLVNPYMPFSYYRTI